MDTLDTSVPNGEEGSMSGMEQPELSCALISAREELRETVFEAIRDAALPIRIGLDITSPSQPVDPRDLERLRSADPDLVILDMAEDPVRTIRTAGAIATGSPGAALIGVGPEMEASHLLDAMRAGLVEYVPGPVEAVHIREALERVMRKQGWSGSPSGDRGGKLLAFFSPKGGSGSTTVVTNTGIELHRLTGRKTLLVDLDLELGEIASLLGVEPRFHFVDLLRNFHRMDADLLASYIERHESGVHVLSAPFEPERGEAVTGEQIAQVLGFLRRHYDYVLVDTSKSLAPPSIASLQSADLIFLITNMDVPSLRNLKRCLPMLDAVTGGEPKRLRLVVNRFNPKSLVRMQDLEETLGIELYWTLTNDYETAIQSISVGEPLVMEGTSRYAEQLKELARDIVNGAKGSTRSKSSLVARLLSPFRSTNSRNRSTLKSRPVEVSTHG